MLSSAMLTSAVLTSVVLSRSMLSSAVLTDCCVFAALYQDGRAAGGVSEQETPEAYQRAPAVGQYERSLSLSLHSLRSFP